MNFAAQMNPIKGNTTLVNDTFNVTDYYTGKLIQNEVYGRTALNITFNNNWRCNSYITCYA